MLRFTAALADNCGNTERALRFARAALDAVDEDTDPIEAALVHERIGRYMYYENYVPDDLLEHNRPAVRLVPEVPPSVERAQVLARSASSSWSWAGTPKRSRRARCASRSARGGCPCHRGSRGQHPRQRAERTRSSRGRAGRAGDRARHRPRDRVVGRPRPRRRERERRTCRHSTGTKRRLRSRLEGAEQARRHGLDLACGAFLRINAGVSLYELGRWDEMEEQLREADAIEAAGVDELRSARVGDPVRGRGQFDAAEAQIQRGRSLLRGSTNAEVLLEFAMVEARVRAWSGDRAAAFLLAEHAFEERVFASSCSDAGPRCSPWRLRSRKTTPRSRPSSRRSTVGLPSPGGAEATGRRAVDRRGDRRELHRTDPDVWRAVADAWAQSPRIPNATYARYREAAAHVTVSGHRAGRGHGVRCVRDGDHRWFRSDCARIEALAAGGPRPRNSRGAYLGGRAGGPHRPRTRGAGTRDRGRTNRQIGEELFISTKTACTCRTSSPSCKSQIAGKRPRPLAVSG